MCSLRLPFATLVALVLALSLSLGLSLSLFSSSLCTWWDSHAGGPEGISSWNEWTSRSWGGGRRLGKKWAMIGDMSGYAGAT